MMYYIIPAILLAVIAFVVYNNTGLKKLNKYKFLFRDDIYSHAIKDNGTRDTAYQLTPVMRGEIYRPYYMYLPQQDQYLVCSELDPVGFRRYDAYAPPHIESVKRHVLFNNKGEVIRSIDSKFNYSPSCGMFFTPEYYINWLPTGDTTQIAYAAIYNKNVDMNRLQFADTFRELYAKADYVDFVQLRTKYNDHIDAGVVFKIKQEWHILLDGVSSSNLYGKLKENDRTGVDNYIYSLIYDYDDPDGELENPYPASPPMVNGIYLETEDPNPYGFSKRTQRGDLKMVKYLKHSSTGWQGIEVFKGIPIFVPGSSAGIAFVDYKIGTETIHFKILDVKKKDYYSLYNLGVRAFKIPTELQIKGSLTFIESTQNYGPTLRDGIGIYVLRPCAVTECSTSSLPNGISEERYAQLPISLQVALMDIEGTTQLVTTGWYPELELFLNLEYLCIEYSSDAIPDGIASLKKLEVLDLKNSRVDSISDKICELKQLKVLNISRNRLGSFPESILELKELTHLDISWSNICEIPDSISRLTKLRQLNLLYIDSISLPETMLTMTDLRLRKDEDFKESLPEHFHFLFEE